MVANEEETQRKDSFQKCMPADKAIGWEVGSCPFHPAHHCDMALWLSWSSSRMLFNCKCTPQNRRALDESFGLYQPIGLQDKRLETLVSCPRETRTRSLRSRRLLQPHSAIAQDGSQPMGENLVSNEPQLEMVQFDPPTELSKPVPQRLVVHILRPKRLASLLANIFRCLSLTCL